MAIKKTLAAAAAVVFLSACSPQGDTDTTTSADPTTQTPVTSEPAAPETTATPTEEPANEQDASSSQIGPDDQLVGTDSTRLTFGAPSDWTVIEASQFEDLSDEDLQAASDAMGMTPEQLKTAIGQAEIQLYDLDTAEDFADNANLLLIPGITELPTLEQIEQEFTAIPGTESISASSEETPIGPATRADYTLDIGDYKVEGSSLFVAVDGTVANITVSTKQGRDVTAATRMDNLIPTLGYQAS